MAHSPDASTCSRLPGGRSSGLRSQYVAGCCGSKSRIQATITRRSPGSTAARPADAPFSSCGCTASSRPVSGSSPQARRRTRVFFEGRAECRRARERCLFLRSLRGLRLVPFADLGRTAIGPRRDERDLERRQRRVVREFAVAACGFPDGHFSRQDFLFDGGRPRTRVFIGRQRDGRGSAARMAVRAARLDDGGDFAVPRDFGGEGVVGRDVHRREQGPRENGCQGPPKACHVHGSYGVRDRD